MGILGQSLSDFGVLTRQGVFELRVGAGGERVLLDIAPDGTRVSTADTGRGNIWNHNTSHWDTLLTLSNNPLINPPTVSNVNVIDIALNHGTTDVIYIIAQASGGHGVVLKSSDKAGSWAQCVGFPDNQITDGNNTNFKFIRHKIATDPNNPAVVYCWYNSDGGSNLGGCYQSYDSGATATNMSPGTIPSALSGFSGGCTIFDTWQGTTTVGGVTCTKVVYTMSWGNGVYKSSDGGATWTQVANGTASPFKVGQMYITPWQFDTNTLWAFETGQATSPQKMWLYDGTTWTDKSSVFSGTPQAVAFDGNTSGKAYLFLSNMRGHISADNGATKLRSFSPDLNSPAESSPNFWSAAGDGGWLNNTMWSGTPLADLAWDPLTSRVYFANGVGTGYFNIPATNVAFPINCESYGEEDLVSTSITATPFGQVFYTVRDRLTFNVTNSLTRNPTGTEHIKNFFGISFQCDWASSDGKFTVSIGGSSNNGICLYASDGINMRPFASFYGDITAIANNGSGLARCTIADTTGMTTYSAGSGTLLRVSGASQFATVAAGVYGITVIDSTHFDLQGSSFSGTGLFGIYSPSYMSQDRQPMSTFGTNLIVSNAISGTSGRIRLTVGNSGSINSSVVRVANVGGTTEANGLWPSPVIVDGTHIELTGSTFVNAYTGGGEVRALTFNGGSIAASTSLNIVMCGGSTSMNPLYTTDAGVTWLDCDMSALAAPKTGWVTGPSNDVRCFAADRTVPNKFYGANRNAFMKSTDSGATWVSQNTTSPVAGSDTNLGNQHVMCSTWDYTQAAWDSDVWYSTASGGTGALLYHSTDEGVTWTSITDVDQVKTFDFGKERNSGEKPTIIFRGSYSGTLGVWVMENYGVNGAGDFTQIANFTPYDRWCENAFELAADKNTFARAYFAMNSFGAAMVQA